MSLCLVSVRGVVLDSAGGGDGVVCNVKGLMLRALIGCHRERTLSRQ